MHKVEIRREIVERVTARRGRLHLYDSLDPKRTALVVIDMQNAFVAPGSPLEVPGARAIVAPINRLAAELRRRGHRRPRARRRAAEALARAPGARRRPARAQEPLQRLHPQRVRENLARSRHRHASHRRHQDQRLLRMHRARRDDARLQGGDALGLHRRALRRRAARHPRERDPAAWRRAQRRRGPGAAPALTQEMKGWLVCGFLSSLLYAAMNLFVPLLYEGYSLSSQTVSELSAIGAPTRTLWVWLGALFSLLVIGFGWGVWKSAGPNRALRAFGAVTVTNGVFMLYFPPMQMRGAEFALTDAMHIGWTVVTLLLMLLRMGCAAAGFA